MVLFTPNGLATHSIYCLLIWELFPFLFFSFLFFSFFYDLKKNVNFIVFLVIFILFFGKIFNFPIFKEIGHLPILNRIIFTKYLFPFYFSFYALLAISLNFFFKKKKNINKILLIIVFVFINLILFFGLYEIIKFEKDLATKYIKINYIFKHISLIYLVFFILFIFLLAFLKSYKSSYYKIIICFIFLFEFFISSNILIKKKIYSI
ncbi:MAG: hypothetical protein KatS3mg092_0512 [Patescibacteria group bacterium]|nr:MAG: hypothetical protein KatS3mg092_0512 [Patescibacteria group bacterium]